MRSYTVRVSQEKSEISVDIRKLIILHWNYRKSERIISEILNTNKSTVFIIISKYKKANSVKNKEQARHFIKHQER